MSSLYVRSKTELWTKADTSINFYPTVNVNQEPADDIWLTANYEAFDTLKETYCMDMLENGEINLLFFGRAGIGYNALFAAAETYAKTFFANTDTSGRLVLVLKNAPIDFAGRNNPWFIVEIAIEYQLRG